MRRHKNRVLALDFDGVICNSETEVLRVALEAYFTLCPESSLANPSSSDRARIAQGFLNLVPLGNRGEDFGVALRAIDDKVTITNQAEYDCFFSSLDQDWRETYHHEFYRHRENLRSADLKSWLELHSPYSKVVHYLEELEDLTLAIVTAKDGPSVRLLLSSFGIPNLFSDDHILDKSVGVEKTNHLKILKKRLNVAFEDITFIDDKVRHLEIVSPLGVDPVLATWGYNSKRERDLARSLGFRLASLDCPSTILPHLRKR